jgi:cytochrome c
MTKITLATLASGLILSVVSPAHANSGDAISGAKLFKQRCTVCHVTTKGAKETLAPNLAGLKGSVGGTGTFAFSSALKKAAIKWNAATLDQFLKSPSKMVPGTRMVTPVPNEADRANIVAYLLTL